MDAIPGEKPNLTDFMDLPTLQEIQDSFAAVANVKATITDADGNVLTQPVPTREFMRRQRAIAQAHDDPDGPQKEGAEFVAPIIIANQRLGTIRMSVQNALPSMNEQQLTTLADKFGMDAKQMRNLCGQLARCRTDRPAAIQFLFLLANAIARLCFQEYQLRQRVNELTAVYNVSMLLADARDLNTVLQRTVQLVAEIMQVKASSIRLIDHTNDELLIRAVHNLSPQYLSKGPILLSRAEIDRIALGPQGYEYVADMTRDPRVQYPSESRREGIVSMLSVGMRYKGRSIGVLRVYTAQEQIFSPLRIDLMKAVAAQAAAAIENARLLAESIQAEALEKQVRMAAEVQQRMIPKAPPSLNGVDLAAVYVPCFELGGDFYDFIPLQDDNYGLVVADVSGKGVPASLIMASVRAFIRAEVDNLYYLYEIMGRINRMLCRDTQPSEFVTLFYGVLDTRNKRLTYCNAGHPPPLLLRDGKISELHGDNLVLGVEATEEYRQQVLELHSGDVVLFYTDGLPDAMNFNQETFGRQRVLDAFAKGGDSADGLAQHLLWEVRRYVGLSRPTDDITMMVAKIR